MADGKATVPAESVMHIMSTIGEPIPMDRLELLLKKQGVERGGELNEAQFLALLKS